MPVALKVNGTPHRREVEARLLLSDFIRHELRLAGTHVGCEHGVCGACTVLDRRRAGALLPDARRRRPTATRCTTVEGLAADRATCCTRCRRRCTTVTALQCGYCTAGILMTHAALLDDMPEPGRRRESARRSRGNLCRCTGYQHIVDAVLRAADKMRS